MPQPPHVETPFTSSEKIRDIVIGMSDGLAVPFAPAAGLINTSILLIRLTPVSPIGSVRACRGRTSRRLWPSSRRGFRDDAACRAYLAACRWPDGYRCPRCAHAAAFELTSRRLWQCEVCGHQTSVTAGTVLHRTRITLPLWFWAAYLVATHTPGISGLQLQRQLGITRYETAWAPLQKLRRAMVRPDREPLQAEVEVAETYIGGPEVGLRGGRHLLDKALVVAAVEVRGRASGRVRLQVGTSPRARQS